MFRLADSVRATALGHNASYDSGGQISSARKVDLGGKYIKTLASRETKYVTAV